MSPIRSPFFRTVRSLWDTYVLRRPFYYPSEHGAERRRHDQRRVYIEPLVEAWVELRPQRVWYNTDAEYQSAVWVWDDGARAITSAIRVRDRRRGGQAPALSFSTLVQRGLGLPHDAV